MPAIVIVIARTAVSTPPTSLLAAGVAFGAERTHAAVVADHGAQLLDELAAREVDATGEHVPAVASSE
ncbi:MAG: hypothetical protein WAT39_07760 [Planctomycetota bacterium]